MMDGIPRFPFSQPTDVEEFDINEAAGKLQSEFARVDLMTRRQNTIPGATEFLILKMEDLKLKMYQEIGHRRPHLHVDYGSQRHAASYAVDTGERLEGDLPRKYDRAVSCWIATHRDQLNSLWNVAQAGQPVKELILAIQES